jgi:uncharacterized membrane protein (UPF0127 family)
MSYLNFSGTIDFEHCKFPLKVAADPTSIQVGMMGARSMSYALVFLIQPGRQGFWMRDCLISLDILFLQNGKVVQIYHSCPPCSADSCPLYEGVADLVVELPGGTAKLCSITEGQSYKIKLNF